MLSANSAAPCTVEELYDGKDFQVGAAEGEAEGGGRGGAGCGACWVDG